jgi:hypothetical protein
LIESVSVKGGRVRIAQVMALASLDEMEILSHAAQDLAFLVALVDRAVSRINAMHAASPQGQEAAKAEGKAFRKAQLAGECAMLCEKQAFWVFLKENHGFEGGNDKASIAQHVRSMLRITSRAEIDHDEAALAGWKRLRADYYSWQKGRAW